MTRFVGRFVLLAISIFIALNVMAYFHAYSMLNFVDTHAPKLNPAQLSFTQKLGVLLKGVTLPRPKANLKPTHLSTHCSSIRIKNGINGHLGTWYCPNTQQEQLIILFHGYGMDKSSLLNVARYFIEQKYSVLLVDFRGSWESSESYTTIGYAEAEDVATMVNFAQQHFAHKKLVLYGQSMGTAAILRAAHSLNVHADALILELVFDNLLNTVKNRFDMMNLPAFPAAHLLVFWGSVQNKFNGFSHNPVEYAKTLNIPVLFLHGDADQRAKLTEAQRVYRAVPTPEKKLVIFPKAAHESLLKRSPMLWKNAVQQFLNNQLTQGKNS